ncbi:apolipoprotein N-acyltransferase [Sulfuritortus calidifontis]|uniref:apolipoprotein N-acyltransferase n=1 Tax=Sulfuritortus calidifontis TaxID=1914471 RepID=UPI000F829750|nr:apolipoprotein N-acyltransferase [Sulfuritortus calidifontis]
MNSLILPLALGALAVAGFAPWGWFPLPILALAVLYHLARTEAVRAAAFKGFAFGLGYFGGGVSWVYVSLHDFGMMPLPLAVLATALFCAFLALFPAAALALTARLGGLRTWRALTVAPALWLLNEWLRGWLFTGFPWLALGYSQVPLSPLAGYAPIIGTYGVSGLVALTAAALALRRGWPLLLAAGLWLGGWGLQQIDWTRPVGAPVTVSLVQGNVAQEMKFRPERAVQTLQDYLRLSQSSNAKLIVLPETALPMFLDDAPPAYLELLHWHARSMGGDLLLGVPERLADGRYFNSVISLGVSPRQTYRKQHLVPFGEFVPWGFGWVVDYLHIPLSDFSRGDKVQPPLAVAGQQVAVNICYEDAFGEEVIRALPAASLLVNVSNDAWFGDSFSPWQHLQLAQMRALETGRPMLRANNTGITAIIDAKGRVSAQLQPFVQGVLHGRTQGHQGLTPYARFGNGPALLLAVLGLLTAKLRPRGRQLFN